MIGDRFQNGQAENQEILKGENVDMEREKIFFDVLFVGGGPANLAGAIRLLHLAKKKNLNLEVALIEKGADIGAHAVSGAILNQIALKELLPDFLEKECPIETIVRKDEFFFLTRNRHFRLPFTPRHMHNKGLYIISLSKFTKWLGQIAEDLGVNIFPGFAGKEVLFASDQKTISGIRTGDKGIGKDGQLKNNLRLALIFFLKLLYLVKGQEEV